MDSRLFRREAGPFRRGEELGLGAGGDFGANAQDTSAPKGALLLAAPGLGFGLGLIQRGLNLHRVYFD